MARSLIHVYIEKLLFVVALQSFLAVTAGIHTLSQLPHAATPRGI